MSNWATRFDEYRHSWADNCTILLGAAIGGYLGLIAVAIFVMPILYSSRSLADLICCGVGIIFGYPPGIVVRMNKSSRLTSFIVAMGSGAILTALLAYIFGEGAGA